MPCIKETVFKYQILAIHFSLSSSAVAHSTVFSAGRGDCSNQTDGNLRKAMDKREICNGIPLGNVLLIPAPTFMVCSGPYAT